MVKILSNTEQIISESDTLTFKQLVEQNKYNLINANLFRSNLNEINLSFANLRGANLHGANLHGANLREADLGEADLGEANLYRVNLCEANLYKANLIKTNLNVTNLSKANLSHADLTNANLNGVYLNNAHLNYANLTGIKGLIKTMNVKPGDIYWKRFNNNLINNNYQFKVGLNELRPGEVFASDEQELCSSPGFHFASREWCAYYYFDRPYEAKIRIPIDAKINEPWATDGKASADKIEILQVYEIKTGRDVTEYFK
jgi:hypothetical protein